MRKRKYNPDELRNIFNETASESEESEKEELVTLSVVSLNTYLGTKKEKTASEKPWCHGLKVYPSKEFFNDMKMYDELRRAKMVRQNHKYNKIIMFI